MTEVPHFQPQDRPFINPLYLFRWEESQDSYVMLYPEGVVKLNETAGAILRHCDGETAVSVMIEELRRTYSGGDGQVAAGVHNFLKVAHAKGWIRIKS